MVKSYVVNAVLLVVMVVTELLLMLWLVALDYFVWNAPLR